MDIEKIKKLADKYLLNSQALMKTDGFLTPVIFAIDENNIKPCTVAIENNEDEKMFLELIHEFSKTAKALIVIIDTFVVDTETKPEKIREHPEASELLSCFVYTKEIGLVHLVPYAYSDGRYTFHDMGWAELDKNFGNYRNPYEA